MSNQQPLLQLKLVLPTRVLLEEEATKVAGEAANGSFVLLPNHIDFATALVPSIFSFHSSNGQEQLVAIDEGLLVKTARSVFVSVKRAIRGTDLEELEQLVDEEFRRLDDIEEKTRAAIAHLEVNFRSNLYHSGGGWQ
jgi:F-type H+-transporting ATPase subunit epsilon